MFGVHLQELHTFILCVSTAVEKVDANGKTLEKKKSLSLINDGNSFYKYVYDRLNI